MEYVRSRAKTLKVDQLLAELLVDEWYDTKHCCARSRTFVVAHRAERVVMGSRMFDVARAMALASFPPGLSEVERKGRLCERLYGNEVDVEAYVKHLLNQKKAPTT